MGIRSIAPHRENRRMKKSDTRLIHTRRERLSRTTVNPPIERASTLLFPDAASLYGAKPTYGRMGLTVHRELEAAMGELEGAKHTRLAANGLQAVALAIAAVVSPGDHILFPDCAYGPTARFCERRLKAMGVEAERYSPRIGADITARFRPNTRLVYMESPGSLTFEVTDIPAISAAAKARGIVTIADNTWAAGYFCQPLALGADITLQALTKYPCGHADVFGGAVMTNDASLAAKVAAISEDWGVALAPDDAYQILRGLRTLGVRLRAHEAAALELAHWLGARDEIKAVLHPALATHPDHALWARDFTGASGLFGFVLNAPSPGERDRFLNALHLFGMGFSWGGYESLIIPTDEELNRLPGDWAHSFGGALMRLHAGLEDVDDLKRDLEHAFAAMRAT